jgi:heat shock protein HslJ
VANRGRFLPSNIAGITVVALLIAGCSSLTVDDHDLEGTRWIAVSVVGRAPIAGSEPTLRFEGGVVSGSMGCNTYASQGSATITNGRLRLGTTLMTLGRCIETGGGDAPVMAIESAFSTALDAADRIVIRGDQLIISGEQGELVFERQP